MYATSIHKISKGGESGLHFGVRVNFHGVNQVILFNKKYTALNVLYQTHVQMSSHCVQKCPSGIGVKCLPANTQHSSEWFSDVIWKRLPKTVLVVYGTVMARVYDVVLTFNALWPWG